MPSATCPHLITPADAEKLHKAGVNTTEELLAKAAKTKDRKALAKASGLSAGTLLDLARRCDLLRIKGVGSEMVLLLEAAGVKSIAELAKKDAPGLLAAITTANSSQEDHREAADRAPGPVLDRRGQEAAGSSGNEVVRPTQPAIGAACGRSWPALGSDEDVLIRVAPSRCPPQVTPSAAAPPPGQIATGAMIGGRFRIEEPISHDTVGHVYRAFDTGQGAPAAVRVIPLRLLGASAAQLEVGRREGQRRHPQESGRAS